MDHVSVVTGANSGIGLATALRLARAGKTVYGTARRGEGLTRINEKASQVGCEIRAIAMDVADTASVERAVDHVLSEVGRVDSIVNNAGVGGNGVVEDCPPELMHDVLDANVVGVLRCCRAVLPSMRQSGKGRIVNISSGLGRVAGVAQAAYVTSKWALEGLSESLAQEVAPFGIHVSIIEPGVTRTAIFRKNADLHESSGAYADQYARMFAFYAEGFNHATPAEEVAAAVESAIDSPTPRLRQTVSWGAAALIDGRAAMSDEDWVALGALPNGAYASAFAEAFGIRLAEHLE